MLTLRTTEADDWHATEDYTEAYNKQGSIFPALLQVPAAVHSAAGSYSNLVIVFTAAKRLVCKLLPDVARTCRMWRQFLPIYVRCKWTAWRYQESRGFSAEVWQRPCLALLGLQALDLH